MEEKILKIVDNTQTGCVNHLKNIRLLENVYNSSDLEEFLQCFLRILQGVVQEDFQNPSVKFILEFLAKFVGHIASLQTVEENTLEKEPPAHPFLEAVLQQIIKFHDDPAQECRHNTCCFLSLTLQNIGDNAVVDSHIIDLIQNAMLENIQDSKPLIRLQAVLALTRLQDPLNPECPVIRAYVNCLRDSSHLVRREAVKRIAPNALTIPKLKEKTRDRDANVRCAAFTHLADIGIKHFKIVHRQFILKSGFMETNNHVKKIFLEYLLPKWLTGLNGSYLALLHAVKLDAEESDIVNTEELSSQIMEVFFKTEPINNLIEGLPLEETKVVPENNIKSELAHYWNIIVKYLRQSEDLEEFLDRIIPELTTFCNYMERLISNKFSKAMEDWEYLDFQYLLYHLFDMAENYDLSEEVGRRALDKLIKKVLRKHRLQPRLLNKMMQIGNKLASNMDSFTNEICLIISDIWQPLTDQAPNAHDQREKDFKIAEITVKLNILEGDREDAVIEQDFEKAQKVKLEIEEYKRKLEELRTECAPVEQVRVTTEDSDTLCWCLDLLAALLVHSNVKTLTPSLAMCREEFLMPLVTSKTVEIGWRAFKCLTVYCIFDKKLAEEQIKTLCVPIATYRIIPNFNKTILIDSIGVIADLIRLHGTDLFNTEDETNTTNSTTQSTAKRRLYNEDGGEVDSFNSRLTVDFIISVLLDMLDDENDDIRDTAATAVAKLMLNEFPINSMVMTRLILKWYNPLTRMADGGRMNKDKRRNLNYEKTLQQKLGVIIKAYTDKIADSREVVAKSIVPILTSIAGAPRTSPLAEIDIDNVIRFLAAITDSEETNGLMHVHTELARIVIQEISMRPSEVATVYFAKMLNLLNISADNSPAVKELITNAELVLEKEALEKAPKHHVLKFVSKLNGNSVSNSTVNTTAATSNMTANTTGCQDTTDQSAGQSVLQPRRLSAVVEEDDDYSGQSVTALQKDNMQEEVDGGRVPSKRRRIDLGDEHNSDREKQNISASPANSSRVAEENIINNNTNKDVPNVEAREAAITSNHDEDDKSSTSESDIIPDSQPVSQQAKSCTSESDIIPNSQPESQQVLRRTRRGAKPLEQDTVAEKVLTKEVSRNKKDIVKKSALSNSDVPGTPRKITRSESKNGAKQVENKTVSENEMSRRSKYIGRKSIGTDMEPSQSSGPQDVISSRKKNKKITEKRLTKRAIVRKSRIIDSDPSNTPGSCEQVVPPNPSAQEKTRKSSRMEARNEPKQAESDKVIVEKVVNTRVIGRISTNTETEKSSEQVIFSSPAKHFRQGIRTNTRSNAKDRAKNMDKAAEKEANNPSVVSRKQATNKETKQLKPSSSSDQPSSSSPASEKDVRKRTRRGAKSKSKDIENNNLETNKNISLNGLQKENDSLQPLAKRSARGKLVFTSKNAESRVRRTARHRLGEHQENNLVRGKELSLKINGHRKVSVAPAKTPQVKRKKMRRSNSRIEQSTKNISDDICDSSIDQTLHTIVEPSAFHVSVLTDDSPMGTPIRSSRRLRVVVSETSSDESPSSSIRKSNRKIKKKMFPSFVQ